MANLYYIQFTFLVAFFQRCMLDLLFLSLIKTRQSLTPEGFLTIKVLGFEL